MSNTFQSSYDLNTLEEYIKIHNVEAILESTVLFQALYFKYDALKGPFSEHCGRLSHIKNNIIYVTIPDDFGGIIMYFPLDLEKIRKRLLYLYQNNDKILAVKTYMTNLKIEGTDEKCKFSDYILNALPFILKDISEGFIVKTKKIGLFDLDVKNKYTIHWYEGFHIELDHFSNIIKPYKEQILTDFTFRIGDKNISCHKIILYNYGGEVFQTILTGSFKEKYQNEITIENYSFECVKFFVDGIYYGPRYMFEHFNETELTELLQFSDQYNVEWLKKVALKTLSLRVTKLKHNEIKELRSLFSHWDHLNKILKVKEKENNIV